MSTPHTEDQNVLLHNLAIYRQLSKIYPKDPKYLQRYIEILMQLQKHDDIELLLEQLQVLLRGSGLKEDAEKAETIRKHLSQEMLQSRYYSTPFLHLASSNWMKKIFSDHKRVRIKEGKYLIHRGDKESQMYIVLHGSLAVWSQDIHGNNHFEHTLHAGEVIGELAFLDGTARNADVIACEDSTLLAIPNKTVFELFISDPKIETTLREEANIRKIQVAMKANTDLAKLPPHLQRVLAKEGKFIHLNTLERIYPNNASIENIDLICDGHLQLVGEKRDGSSVMLNSLKAGILLGCAALTPHMDKTYVADVVSMNDSTIVRFPLSIFQKVVALNPRLYQSLLRQAETEHVNLGQTISKEREIK